MMTYKSDHIIFSSFQLLLSDFTDNHQRNAKTLHMFNQVYWSRQINYTQNLQQMELWGEENSIEPE